MKSKLAILSLILILIVLISLGPFVILFPIQEGSSDVIGAIFTIVVFLSFPLIVISIIFAIMSLVKISKNNQLTGKWMAVSAIILSVPLLLFELFLIFMMIVVSSI